ncbi:hypothetical protein [Streptomyces sp. NPDC101150]|uniref:hypothetical protein n=1 Tax=Streptomyces sp. NPDC101150 TaxID=3366114 RepID=UPI003826AEE6
MRDTVGRGRSADADGVRGLLLFAVLTLLQAALLIGACHLPSSQANHCLAHAPTAGTSTMSVAHCIGDAPELTSAGGRKHHPGSGARRGSEASACPLRHQAPTGTCGKAIGDTPLRAVAAASGGVSPGAVHAVVGQPPERTVVLRC